MLTVQFKPVVFRDRKGDEVIIRPYDHASDREKLIDMYASFSSDNRCLGLPPSTRGAISRWIDYLAENGIGIVAEIDGRIVGHTVVVPTEDGKDVDLTIFVHQDFQDRGIGQEMMKRMIEFCREAGFEGITLVTERTNARAIHVYMKLGFEIVNPHYEYDMYLKLK
jgi:ribosomal protein S18 acetylase RimI-like enzyme